MFQEIFAQSDLLIWPLVSLLIFVTVFLAVLAFMFLGLRDRKKIDKIAALPFAEESVVDNRTEGGAV